MAALDDDGFRQFVATRSHALLRSAYLLTGDRHLAEDLVQSALEKTITHWQNIKVPEAAEAYVRQTMLRHQLSVWRRGRVREQLGEAVPEPREAGGSDTVTEQVEANI